MNRTTILMEACYLLPLPKSSMYRRISDFGTLWLNGEASPRTQLEHIREKILAELGGTEGCMRGVTDRVNRAHDITDLWFLRCSLATALTVDRGADDASASMLRITALFNGLLPKGLRERRSALNH